MKLTEKQIRSILAKAIIKIENWTVFKSGKKWTVAYKEEFTGFYYEESFKTFDEALDRIR